MLSSNATTLAGKKVGNKLAETDRRHESSSRQQLGLLGDIHRKVDAHMTAISRLNEGMYVSC